MVNIVVSTVTVSDETRRKIKRLAALLDTTQNRIVERAIALFEREILKKQKKKRLNPKVKKALEEAKRIVKERDPEFYERMMKLKSAEIDIEEVISERWGDEL